MRPRSYLAARPGLISRPRILARSYGGFRGRTVRAAPAGDRRPAVAGAPPGAAGGSGRGTAGPRRLSSPPRWIRRTRPDRRHGTTPRTCSEPRAGSTTSCTRLRRLNSAPRPRWCRSRRRGGGSTTRARARVHVSTAGGHVAETVDLLRCARARARPICTPRLTSTVPSSTVTITSWSRRETANLVPVARTTASRRRR